MQILASQGQRQVPNHDLQFRTDRRGRSKTLLTCYTYCSGQAMGSFPAHPCDAGPTCQSPRCPAQIPDDASLPQHLCQWASNSIISEPCSFKMQTWEESAVTWALAQMNCTHRNTKCTHQTVWESPMGKPALQNKGDNTNTPDGDCLQGFKM